jgi:hypothetical protein
LIARFGYAEDGSENIVGGVVLFAGLFAGLGVTEAVPVFGPAYSGREPVR